MAGQHNAGGLGGGTDGKESACSAGDPGQEDPLEKEMATYSSSLVWRIPWDAVCGVSKSQTRLSDFTFNTVGQFVPTPIHQIPNQLFLSELSFWGHLEPKKANRTQPNRLFLVFPDPKKERSLV